MSEMFGNSSKHMIKQDIMKEEFGWTIPVESVPLPSKGVLYDPDTTIYNREMVPIKAMTAHEEDILMSQAFIKDGTVIDQLIRSCVTDKTFDVEDLISGDRTALMVAIRITGYGSDYNVDTVCQNCSYKNQHTFKLGDLPIKRLKIEPVKKGVNAFKYTLPVTKKEITFKFLTGKDERDRTLSNKNAMSILDSKIEKNVTSFLKYSILSIGGVSDKNKIEHFVRNMPAYDSKSLRQHIRDNEPGMVMGAHYDCASCSHRNDITLPITSEFFWPST